MRYRYFATEVLYYQSALLLRCFAIEVLCYWVLYYKVLYYKVLCY